MDVVEWARKAGCVKTKRAENAEAGAAMDRRKTLCSGARVRASAAALMLLLDSVPIRWVRPLFMPA